MNTQRQYIIALIAPVAAGTASCDIPPVAPEVPTATTVASSDDAPDPAADDDETPHQFQFDIVLMDEGARELAARIRAQADRWARVVEGSDLEDIEWEPGTISCGGLQHDYQKDVLDDVFIMISVRDYFTGPTTGSGVRICGYRESSKLPLVGAVFLDIEGVPEDHVDDLILHQFGHMLGFGLSWEDLDLLRNPAWDNEGADTHFTGSRATAAFVAAGGANYTGSKVPVENYWTNGTVDYHWRKSVFGTELMAPWLDQNVADPLSAITIQSLADIGYTVDLAEADRFIVPGSSAAARAAELTPATDLTGDVVAFPAASYDRHGSVVRMIRR